jgi:hypothetical protein
MARAKAKNEWTRLKTNGAGLLNLHRIKSHSSRLLFRRLSLGVLAAEALYTSSRVQHLLLAGEERMAVRANFDVDVAPMGGTGSKAVAARAQYAYVIVRGMDSCLHDH